MADLAAIRSDVASFLRGVSFHRLYPVWDEILNDLGDDGARALCLEDRYYLFVVACERRDAWHPWLYERCREVEADPDGRLDLWAREHYKSSLLTFAGSIQEILRNPSITIGIFSHTKPIARKFLVQIKEELERNQRLQMLFPDTLWTAPHREAPRWSEEKGIVVRRSSNSKEATVEAHGLVDGQPTGVHFQLLIYDDVVTLESVSTPEQVAKTTAAWELSNNLGARGEDGRQREWMIGTRYSFRDTYQTIIERKAAVPRVFPATANGAADGEPVLLSREVLADKRLKQGPATFACQMLQNPAAGNEALFKPEWLRFADVRPRTLNVYITVDPASSKKKGSDRTAMVVTGIDAGRNKYLLDGLHHRMSLGERWAAIKRLRRRWREMPGVQLVRVGYERFGLQDALEYFEERQRIEGEAFEIVELAWPSEGPGSKYDRIQRLQPDFAAGKWHLAAQSETETRNQRACREAGEAFRIFDPPRGVNEAKAVYSLNAGFLDEYLTYPFSVHDDFLDAMSRLYDMDPMPPVLIDEASLEPEV